MKFIKLNEADSLEMYFILKELKKQNWIVDIRDFKLFGKIFEYHLKITDLISAYDGLESMEQISNMVKDMTDYFKQDIKIITKKKCSKCRRLLPVEEFFSKKSCDKCRIKK